jgi:N-ethylmaleimide reductase
MALQAVASGAADAVSIGRPFISNPDLVRRLRENAPLQPLVGGTVYASDAVGYTDYPTLDQASA